MSDALGDGLSLIIYPHCLQALWYAGAFLTHDDFCCAGCSYVFQMLHESGLEHFYDLRGGQALSPVLPQSLREHDFTWLEPLKEKAEEQLQQAELTLSVQGLSCIGCIWLIDRVYTKAGGGRLSADIAQGRDAYGVAEGQL